MRGNGRNPSGESRENTVFYGRSLVPRWHVFREFVAGFGRIGRIITPCARFYGRSLRPRLYPDRTEKPRILKFDKIPPRLPLGHFLLVHIVPEPYCIARAQALHQPRLARGIMQTRPHHLPHTW